MAASLSKVVLHSGHAESPLGRLSLAAEITDGHGIVPPVPLRVYGRYAVVYITKGRGRYRDSNGFAQDVAEGDLIMVYPDLAHTYGPAPGECWSELYVVFDGPAIDSWRRIGVLNPKKPVFHLQPVSEWSARLRSVIDSGPAQSAAEVSVQICRLLTLLTEIAMAQEAVEPDRNEPNWLTRACNHLSDGLSELHRIEVFAERSGLSEQQFRARFKRELGISPMRFRANKRMETACDLLQYTGMTNIQIAASLGFSDEYHFSKRFKELIGESPRGFRQRVLSRR